MTQSMIYFVVGLAVFLVVGFMVAQRFLPSAEIRDGDPHERSSNRLAHRH